MDNIKEELLKELNRFKEIGRNSENLTEQQMIGGGSGFIGQQGDSDTLKKFHARQEMGEQEEVDLDIPLDPEAEVEGGEDVDVDIAVDAEVEGGEEESVVDDIETADEIDVGAEDTTELDVTDLVSKQDEVSAELSDQQDILSKNTESLEDLMSKLSQLETHLTSMDSMMSKIDKLEDKLEEYRPRTPEEQQQIRRKYDSGPFSNSLSDFFNDKEEGFEESGKKQYILTKDDVENYSDEDIKKSFADPEEEDDDIRNDYRGVK